MKTSAIFLAIALALSVSAAPPNVGNRPGGFPGGFPGKKGGAGGSKGGAGGAAGGAAGGNSTGANNGTATAGGANNGASNNGTAVNNGGTGAAAGAGGDAQTSTTLDPNVIAKGFANDGQDVPAEGQVASLTSTNNFINFCLTVPNLPITNGQQLTPGSCNPAPMGVIPSSDAMPSSKFTVPKNGDTLQENTPFTITMAIKNLETGNFVNADNNYFAAPQQLNAQGLIVGHSHVVIEALTALDQTTPTDPKKFAFFKGLNGVAQGGVLTADVTSGLPAGAYKLSSINAAANHQPVLVPIAQHGSLDDAVYFTVTASGKAATASTAAAGGAAGGKAGGAASTAAAGSKSTNVAGGNAGGKAGGAASASAAGSKSTAVAGSGKAGSASNSSQSPTGGKQGSTGANAGANGNNSGGSQNGNGRNRRFLSRMQF